MSLLSLGLGFKNELTGRDNAYLAGLLQGFTKNDAKQSLSSIEEFCELGDYFDEPVKTYSSGMRARLGFATALLNNASVLLIDEVLSVGDKEFREKAGSALKSRVSEAGAFVLVSHTEAQIKDMCSDELWLDHGGVAARGLLGLGHRVEHGALEVRLAALLGGHAPHQVGAVLDRLLGMEGTLRAGESLADDLGVLVDQDTHQAAPPAAFTACWAASVRLVAAIMFNPLSARTFRPSSALLPSSRTTTGT